MIQRPIGLVSVTTYLPPDIRRNDWWPSDTVARWRTQRGDPPLPTGAAGALTPAMASVLAELAVQAADPFQGVIERRVMPADMTSVDMEVEAAERAIAIAGERAGVERGAIDVLLTHTAVPEYLLSNTACGLHRRLGLAPGCLTLQADGSGNSFLLQLTLAESLIASGRAHHALIVQSAAGSRLLDPESALSPLFGDGASAAVVGPVASGGVVAAIHRTDGSYPRALIAGVPGRRWYDDGRIVLHSADTGAMRQIFVETADRAAEVVAAALAAARCAPDDVALFAVHQGTPWLRRVTQAACRLSHARSVDTFATTGYLFGASLPLVLATAERQAMVSPGDLVVMHGGGVGSTYSAVALRWGAPVSDVTDAMKAVA